MSVVSAVSTEVSVSSAVVSKELSVPSVLSTKPSVWVFVMLAAAVSLSGHRISAYPACAPEVRLAGGEFVDIEVTDAITCGKFVTAPAWPAHPEWLRQLNELL